MLVVDGKGTTSNRVDRETFEKGMIYLQKKGLKPIIRSSAQSAMRAAGIRGTNKQKELYWQTVDTLSGCFNRYLTRPNNPDEKFQTTELLEIIICEKSLLIVKASRGELVILEARDHTAPPRLDEISSHFKDSIESALNQKNGPTFFEWGDPSQLFLVNRLFPTVNYRKKKKIPQATRLAVFTESELASAAALAVPENRKVLKTIAQSKKTLSADMDNRGEDGLLSGLIERNLVREEYIVACRSNSRVLFSVATRGELEAGESYKCATCGRPFSKELIQKNMVLTDAARQLMEQSHWMTVWITGLIVECGIPKENIMWNTTFGEDEIDIIVDLQGYPIFFELKDRDFGLGDADRFVNRIERYGPGPGVVISLGSITAETRKFLARRHKIYIIEGRDNEAIKSEILAIIEMFSYEETINQLRQLLSNAEIDSQRIILNLWKEASGANWPKEDINYPQW